MGGWVGLRGGGLGRPAGRWAGGEASRGQLDCTGGWRVNAPSLHLHFSMLVSEMGEGRLELVHLLRTQRCAHRTSCPLCWFCFTLPSSPSRPGYFSSGSGVSICTLAMSRTALTGASTRRGTGGRNFSSCQPCDPAFGLEISDWAKMGSRLVRSPKPPPAQHDGSPLNRHPTSVPPQSPRLL